MYFAKEILRADHQLLWFAKTKKSLKAFNDVPCKHESIYDPAEKEGITCLTFSLFCIFHSWMLGKVPNIHKRGVYQGETNSAKKNFHDDDTLG